MIEPAQLLHNMSAPPKSVVSYTGLLNAGRAAGPGGSSGSAAHDGAFGTFITFRLPEALRRRGPETILKHLGMAPGAAPGKTLLGLIEARAKELALPDACVITPSRHGYPCPWPDPLAALAIITKSSASIWLRSKTPRLSTIQKTSTISLLVPPVFADQMETLSQ